MKFVDIIKLTLTIRTQKQLVQNDFDEEMYVRPAMDDNSKNSPNPFDSFVVIGSMFSCSSILAFFSKQILIFLIRISTRKTMNSTRLRIQNPLNNPIVPPTTPSFVSKFAFSSFVILSKIGVAK